MTILHLNNLNKQINKIKDIDKIVFCRDLENIASVLINLGTVVKRIKLYKELIANVI